MLGGVGVGKSLTDVLKTVSNFWDSFSKSGSNTLNFLQKMILNMPEMLVILINICDLSLILSDMLHVQNSVKVRMTQAYLNLNITVVSLNSYIIMLSKISQMSGISSIIAWTVIFNLFVIGLKAECK